MVSRLPRARAAGALLAEARGLSGDFDGLSHAVARRVGLGPTDLLALDLISQNGQLTAGQLADGLHLTSGAVTGVIDRLERSGYVRRTLDSNDRRRVFVTKTAKEGEIAELFAPLGQALQQVMHGYNQSDLATLTDFLRQLRASIADATDKIQQP